MVLLTRRGFVRLVVIGSAVAGAVVALAKAGALNILELFGSVRTGVKKSFVLTQSSSLGISPSIDMYVPAGCPPDIEVSNCWCAPCGWVLIPEKIVVTYDYDLIYDLYVRLDGKEYPVATNVDGDINAGTRTYTTFPVDKFDSVILKVRTKTILSTDRKAFLQIVGTLVPRFF